MYDFCPHCGQRLTPDYDGKWSVDTKQSLYFNGYNLNYYFGKRDDDTKWMTSSDYFVHSVTPNMDTDKQEDDNNG